MCECKHPEAVKSFDHFYVEEYRLLKNVALKLVKSLHKAEDLVQDSFLKVRNIICKNGYKDQTHYRTGFTSFNFYPYVQRVMNTMIVDESRKMKEKYFQSLNEDLEETYSLHVETDNALQLLEDDNDHRNERRADVEFIVFVMKKYTSLICEDERSLYYFWWYYEQELTYTEMSKMTGLSYLTIIKHIKPLKDRIREEFPSFLRNVHKEYINRRYEENFQ